MTNKRRLITAAIASTSLLSTNFIYAQEEKLLEEITVTATKREQSIYEVPIAISAFDGDKLAEQGIIDIVDIGKFVPNLNITQFSAGHNSSSNPFIRGIGLQDHLITTDPGVSVYVDGVYLGRQVGQNWSLTNIERVEVLRGPQGTLYGRNSIGGAINIITKDPGSDPGAKVSIEAGSRDRLNGDFYADVALSETLAFSVTGGFKKRGGIGDFTNVPNASFDVGENEEVFSRIAFKYEPSDSFRLIIAADANDGEGGLRPYDTLIDEITTGSLFQAGFRNSDQAPNPFDNATAQVDQTVVTNEASGISITADWDWSETFASKIVASQRESEYQAGLDDDSLEANFLAFPEQGDADQTSIEFQLNGDLGSWDFVSGLYYYEEEGSNNQVNTFFNGDGPGTFFIGQEVESYAVFANVGVDLTEQFRLAVGVRYTEDEKDAETDIGIGLFTNSAEFDEVSWDISATYTFDNGNSIYGAIQNGYQSGQFPARPFCLFGDANCFFASDNITAINYEIGIKGEWIPGFQMSAAFFYTEYEDLPYQVSTTTGQGFATTNLVVEQTSVGFEWESTLRVTDYLLLQTSLGLIEVDVDEQDGVQPEAPLTPEVTLSIGPEFHWTLESGAGITARIDYSYRDEMFGEPSNDPGRFTQIDSRELINANISYQSPDDKWSLSLYGRNITDERYDNARLNTGDYVLRILSNDPSEFGLRFSTTF